jgi:hypothetical protein
MPFLQRDEDNKMPPNPPLPKVAHMPPPPSRPNRPAADIYADEALKSAQRVIDFMNEIDRLGSELDEWRRRAQMAEAELKRYELRESDLRTMLDQQRDKLTDERDAFRRKLDSLVAQFHTAGGIILRCLEAAQGQAGSPVNLTNLANEIEKAEQANPQDEPPIPRVVAAGPRHDEGES